MSNQPKDRPEDPSKRLNAYVPEDFRLQNNNVLRDVSEGILTYKQARNLWVEKYFGRSDSSTIKSIDLLTIEPNAETEDQFINLISQAKSEDDFIDIFFSILKSFEEAIGVRKHHDLVKNFAFYLSKIQNILDTDDRLKVLSENEELKKTYNTFVDQFKIYHFDGYPAFKVDYTL